jgi:hypothetical protein
MLAGCVPKLPGGFDSFDAGERAEAIVEAAERDDVQDVPKLITLLESDDPGTRLLAIQALERITGQRFGYDYAGPEARRRREAIDRWVHWEAGRAARAVPDR